MHPKLLLLTLLALSTFSCGDDFLDREPIDQLTDENFFNTEDEMRSATLAAYSILQSQQWYGEAFEIDEIPSDDSAKSFESAIDNFSANPNNEKIYNYWSGHYRAITLANTVIEKGGESDLDPGVIGALVAEARFIRAISYFNLVRVFGGVPIVTEIPQLDRDLLPARGSVDEVYAFLKADLNAGISVLPAEHNPGRATKGAAQAYLAKVELTLEDYAAARDLSLAVINSGVYSIVDSFRTLFLYPESDNNAESIFEIQFTGCESWGTGNMRQAFYAPFNQNITGGSDGWGVVVPTAPPQDQFGTTAVQIWDEGDARRKWTLLEPNNYYPSINPDKGGYTYPEDGSGGRRANIKKYVMGGGQNVCFMSTPQNASLMRLSEVYHIYAESVTQLGGGVSINQRAVALINELRSRAGQPLFSSLDLEKLELERRKEFMFEGKRYFDILRKGKAEATDFFRLTGVLLTEDKLLFPIPALELEINPNLRQNPGY